MTVLPVHVRDPLETDEFGSSFSSQCVYALCNELIFSPWRKIHEIYRHTVYVMPNFTERKAILVI